MMNSQKRYAEKINPIVEGKKQTLMRLLNTIELLIKV